MSCANKRMPLAMSETSSSRDLRRRHRARTSLKRYAESTAASAATAEAEAGAVAAEAGASTLLKAVPCSGRDGDAAAAEAGACTLLRAVLCSGRGGHGREGGPVGVPVSGQGGHGREGGSNDELLNSTGKTRELVGGVSVLGWVASLSKSML